MKKILFGFIFLWSACLYSQTRPNNFTEILSVDNTNFEVYSQKNGLPRRASLETLKRYFDQALTFSNDTLSLTGVDGPYKVYLPSSPVAAGSNTFQQVISSNSADTINVIAQPGSVSMTTANSRNQYDIGVSKLTDVSTITIVMDLTVATRRNETIIKVDDLSNTTNVSLATTMFPTVTVYDAAPTLLGVNEVYNVTETLTNGDVPYKIAFNNDSTYSIVFGQGDWSSKTKVIVTIKF